MTWEGLWSSARIHLGLSSEEFWSLTPRQFVLLGRAKQVEIMRQEYGPALVCCMVAALAGQKRQPRDFMPSLSRRRSRPDWKDQLEKVKVLHARIGGADGAHSS